MIGALVWKEWQQIRWKLVFSLVIVAAYIWVGLQTRIVPDVAVLAAGSLLTVILLPIFIAMGLFAAEAEEGSLVLQYRLPIEARIIYFIKLFMGAAALFVILFVMLILSLILAANREMGIPHIFQLYGFTFCFGLAYLIWIIVLSITADSEFKVVLVAVGIFFGWGLFCMLDDSFGWAAVSMILTPFGFFEAGFDQHGGTAVSLLQSAFAAFLLYIGMIRFERLAGR